MYIFGLREWQKYTGLLKDMRENTVKKGKAVECHGYKGR